jgi:hypothetical protein
MIKHTVNVNNRSIGPIGLMWVIITTLKLMAIIDWSWWIVVFFPVIASLGLATFFAVIAVLCGTAAWAVSRS